MAKRGTYCQLNQMWVADFETCDMWEPSSPDEIPHQRVWLAGIMNLADMKLKYFTSLDEFMKFILSKQDNKHREIAFHNLKFDGSFIIPWLFEHGYVHVAGKPGPKQFSTLIDERNNWYSITIQVNKRIKVLIWDSLKLFPTALEYLHEFYHTPTRKIIEDEGFYNQIRPVDHVPTDEELKYLENDLRVLAETLNEHIKYYGLRFKKTQAGQSFYNFEKSFPHWRYRFPALSVEDDELIRPAYWGGISYVNPKIAGKDVYGIDVFDINSSYPYQLATRKLPYGKPLLKTGQGLHPDMSKFWVAEAIVNFKLKDDRIPCIPAKAVVEGRPITTDKWLSDSCGVVKIRFSCIDYLTILDSYEFEVISWEWAIHWAWKKHKEIAQFIYNNNEIKVKYKKLAQETDDEELKAEYLTKANHAKIDNNAFYGKFGEEIIKRGKTPHYDEDKGVVYRVDRVEEIPDNKKKFLPVAIATTAWGRHQLVTTANRIGKYFLYCDTDSLHILSEGKEELLKHIKLDKTELGAWSHEGYFDRGRYLRSKCYYEERYGEVPEVTIAGLPADKHSGPRSKKRSCITWENFHIGYVVPAELSNKFRSVRTPMGVKLVPVAFEIKEVANNFDF